MFKSLIVGKKYIRPELAKLWGYNGHQGFSKGVFTPSGLNTIILFVTHIKQGSQTQYNDFISGDYLYWEGERQHGTDIRIAEAHQNGEEIHVFYRDIHHTPFLYYGEVKIIKSELKTTEPSSFVFWLNHDLGPEDDIRCNEKELETLKETDRIQVTKARLGQGAFRDKLLNYWNGCAITAITESQLLRASHIKPWRASNNSERLDSFNGFLLLPQYDHLFDRGFITFNETGKIILSPVIENIKLDIRLVGIDGKAKLRKIESEHIEFLKYHKEEVFVHSISSE
jgi:putative restriction endonuclease